MLSNSGVPETRPRAPSSHSRSYTNEYMHPPEIRRSTTIDQAMNTSAAIEPPEEVDEGQGYKNAVRAWSRFRFVRAGWFTAAEAIDYIT